MQVDTLAESAVTPNKLESGTGTDWAWQDWTPSYTNLTVGNGTVVAKFTQIGKTVHATWEITLGSTSSVSGVITISLPVTAAARYGTGRYQIGSGFIEDTGTTSWPAMPVTNSTTTITVQVPNAQGDTRLANTSSTKPMTWTTSDELMLSFTYEAA